MNKQGFSALHFAASTHQGALCQELLLVNKAHVNPRVGTESFTITTLLDETFTHHIHMLYYDKCFVLRNPGY